MGKMTALLPESLDRCKATQAKFKFPPRRSVPPPYCRAHFDRLIRCFIPRGGMRRRSGFALSLQPECCPFRAHASQSGAGLGPMAASPLLPAPAYHHPPLVAFRPLGLPRGNPPQQRNTRLSASSLAPPRSLVILLLYPLGVPESTVSARSPRDREAGLQGPV